MGMRWFVRWTVSVLIACGSVLAVADTVCHIVIGTDVLELDGLVQQVPGRVVGVAPEVAYGAPEITTADATRATPAIVFIIDDSGSMMQNDKNANRYVVTAEILDEIYREAPATRVAVVTFRNWLAWDWRQNPEFRKISDPFAWNDSYFPLAPLDSVFADGNRTIDKIKGLFTLDQWKLLQAFHSDSTDRTRPQEFDDKGNPIPPSRNQQGTDITLAFMAAKDALRTTSAPVERQFIVFLSDGLHGAVDVEMEETKTDYIKGAAVPTTYTIFLGDSVKEPPQQLRTMVANIRNNGYSSANPNCQLWSIASTHDTLLALMQREILTQVYAPLRMASKASTGTVTTARVTETDLIFTHPLALEPDTTTITFDVVFPLSDAKGNPRGDTVLSSTVAFVRDPQADEVSLHDGLRTECYKRDLFLESGNTIITGAIRNAQTTLDARFTLEGIDPSSDQNMVVSTDPTIDSVPVKLKFREGYFSGTVNRRQADKPVADDATVQHPLGGALRFTWRNPYLPLDTFSRVFPVSPYDPVVITGIRYFDTDRDGRIDGVEVSTDRPVNGKEFDALDGERLVLPSERMLTFESVTPLPERNGFVINVEQSESAPVNTAVSKADTLTITDYATGPYADYVEAGRYAIADGIAPVLVAATFISGKKGDSLQVTFSEPVQSVDVEYPFRFSTTDGISYRMRLADGNADGDIVTFRVISIDPAETAPGMSDSVWIAGAARIRDTSGNVQIEPNRKVLLGLSGNRIDFKVIAGPNPVIRRNRSSVMVKGWGMLETGTLIGIVPDFPVADISRIIEEVDVWIYDAVGNLLAFNPENRPAGNTWFIHWDCTNRSRRQVGRGGYLVVVGFDAKVESKTVTFKKTVKIGIR